MTDLLTLVSEIDSVLQTQPQKGSGKDRNRQRIREVIQVMAGMSSDPDLSLAETISQATVSCPTQAKRTLASILIQMISSSSILTEHDLKQCRKDIVPFIEESCPDLTKHLCLQENAQNHEKLETIKKIHDIAQEHLEQLLQPFVNLEDLARRRQNIMQSINHGICKGYLNAFGYKLVLPLITSLLDQVETVVDVRGHELQTTLQQLIEDIPIHLENCEKIRTFVIVQYAVPFLRRLASSASAMKDRSVKEFACEISVPNGGAWEAEKRYPLHLVGSTIEISIPLNNSGPGVAQNVHTYHVADHCDVRNSETILGNIEPGTFIMTLVIKLTESRLELQAEAEVKWSVVGNPEEYSQDFSISIHGQRTDINWDELARQHPYDLEVAYKDSFYGRKDALDRIISRLMSNTMQSCYITGQKRVGKSSLAHAVQSKMEEVDSSAHYHVLYLECGEIRHATGEQTLCELGKQLEDYLACYFDRHTIGKPHDYSSSLAPLNRLLDTLRRENEHNRFIVILDEFDEVNESLYSHGELANTFFLNLRTLASKRNLAFILVGAEKMPYLMSSQGEKLNKFERESLNSFDQETEWSDFVSLVRDPVADSITFHEKALRRLYDLTDGHPYFTKALCEKVYELALKTKDAEISDVEIDKARQRLLTSLDTNAFAHYWRDGVRGSTDDVEIVAVRRCRTLISWARTLRDRKQPTREEIEKQLYASLQVDDMRRELDNFCRRGVFRVDEDRYSPTVEIFGKWMQEVGFSLIVDGHIGDELEEKKQLEEDAAYVKSNEIVDLVRSWSSYQGGKLTEDRVRAWIEQIETNVQRRWLFKILQNTKFVTDDEVDEWLRQAHKNIRVNLPMHVQRARSERRSDILVTHVGGIAKSGSHCARQYARVNKIVSKNVISLEHLGTKLHTKPDNQIAGVVVADDMIGTGDTLIGELKSLSEVLQKQSIGSQIPLFISVFCATMEGETNVRQYLKDTYTDSDLDVYEVLDERHFAFGDKLGFWESEQEKDKAKAKVVDLGAFVDKRRPLGYREQGLLLTFPWNCPNNSLPILYGIGKRRNKWDPLFPRTQL